jgi:hypothetical protein
MLLGLEHGSLRVDEDISPTHPLNIPTLETEVEE